MGLGLVCIFGPVSESDPVRLAQGIRVQLRNDRRESLKSLLRLLIFPADFWTFSNQKSNHLTILIAVFYHIEEPCCPPAATSVMGVQKKTRKFAQVKRIIGQRDARLKKNQQKGEVESKKKDEDVIREV